MGTYAFDSRSDSSVDFISREPVLKGSDVDEMGGVASHVEMASFEAWKKKMIRRSQLSPGRGDTRAFRARLASLASAGSEAGSEAKEGHPFVYSRVPCVRLDWLLGRLGVRRVDAMWIE